MKRIVIFATAVLLAAYLMTPVQEAEGRGRHRGRGHSSVSVGFYGSSGYSGTSFSISSKSPGFSFFISSGPSYGYGRPYYGKRHRGHFYERHRHGRHEYHRHGRDRYYDRPYQRHGRHRGYSRGGIGGHGPVQPSLKPVVPGKRFWVPGRMTPGGYARGYWDYR